MKKFLLLFLCFSVLGCGDSDTPSQDTKPSDNTPVDAPKTDTAQTDISVQDLVATDASNCEILVDPETGQNVRCEGENPGEQIDCPEGYSCSGLSAFLCYKGDCPNLPICLAHDAMIETPTGPVRVTELRVGTMVWTQDLDGRRVAAPVLRLGSVNAPVDHKMVRVIMHDGRTFRASPGHPMADGPELKTLMTGQTYDGAFVARASLEPYEGSHTYDLLPAGPTGRYWVNGVLLSSTLEP